MSTIVQLYEHYGIDSQYMYMYDRLFSPYRESILPKLEVGCGTGVKTHVMAEYFTNAIVTGLDIDYSQVAEEYANNPRVTYRNVDATLAGAGFLAGGTKYDVVIEDTWLDSGNQMRIFENLAPYLATGGMYIIERFIANDNLQNLALKYGATCDIYDFDDDDSIAVMRFIS